MFDCHPHVSRHLVGLLYLLAIMRFYHVKHAIQILAGPWLIRA